MKAIVDLHTHTLSSGHAFSTLKENIEQGAKVGLKVIGTSDHAPMMPSAPQNIFFENYKVIPEEVLGIRVLKGIEANIYDYNGSIDVESPLLEKMDYIIASLHSLCIKSGSIEENTNALIETMKNPYVKIIGHPDDDRYKVDYDRLVLAAVDHKVALELNNSSLFPKSTRINGRKNAKRLLEKCKEYHAYIIMGSDSHICYDIGNFEEAYKLIQEVNFPEELIINTDLHKLSYVLNHKL